MAPTFSLPPVTVPGGVTWAGSEAVIRLQPGPSLATRLSIFAPTNWASLDGSDSDLGGSGPVLVDVPGATPSALVVQYGKDGKVYLLNRNNLGGVSAPLASSTVGGSGIQAAASYRTAMGTYVVFRPTTNTLTAFRITATNPPTIVSAWSVSSSGRGSPFVTSTDGTTTSSSGRSVHRRPTPARPQWRHRRGGFQRRWRATN